MERICKTQYQQSKANDDEDENKEEQLFVALYFTPIATLKAGL